MIISDKGILMKLRVCLKNLHKDGFSLIELLLVVAIIGVLSTLILVSVQGYTRKAKFSDIQSTVTQIGRVAENVYVQQNASYSPDVGSDTMPSGFSSFMKSWPKPPCPGWTYDYENWNGGTLIRISVRRASPNTAIVYYCVYTTGDCTSWGGGTDINNWTSKQISCNE